MTRYANDQSRLIWVRDYPNGTREYDRLISDHTEHPKQQEYCMEQWELYRLLDGVGYYKIKKCRWYGKSAEIGVRTKGMTIYFICVFSLIDGAVSSERCWGWYSSRDEARRVILNNITDIYENGFYNAAMIEPMAEGVCNRADGPEEWYSAVPAFNERNEIEGYAVSEMPKPDYLKDVVGFAYANHWRS